MSYGLFFLWNIKIVTISVANPLGEDYKAPAT